MLLKVYQKFDSLEKYCCVIGFKYGISLWKCSSLLNKVQHFGTTKFHQLNNFKGGDMPWFSLIGGNWKEELAVEDETLATVADDDDVAIAVVVGLAHWYLTLSFAVICLSTSRSKQFASWTVCKYVCAEKFTYVVVDDVFEKCAVTYVGLNRCLWYYFSMEGISSSLWKVDKSMKHQLLLVVLQSIEFCKFLSDHPASGF